MRDQPFDEPAKEDPIAQLERAFIAEFLERHGHTLTSLRGLSEPEANALLKEASLYAAGKLTEMESRAHYVRDIHHVVKPQSE